MAKTKSTRTGQKAAAPRPRRSSTRRRTGPKPWFASRGGDFVLYKGDSVELLPQLGIDGDVRAVFADPPYFLSNGGTTCHAGKRTSVNKGKWDELVTVNEMHAFNTSWLEACRAVMDPDASIWVSGTRHVIFSVGFAMQQVGYKLLNEITWEKPNPPPNLSCRYFTHSTETVLWASHGKKAKHTFHYKLMKHVAGGKQMKSVWKFSSPAKKEKRFGKHPTQKPVALLERIVLASTDEGDLVVDPFCGSGTTGIAAAAHGRRFVGIDLDEQFLEIAKQRYQAGEGREAD
jgi:site-specific DNA-methyltransferase (adenine-specific)